MFDLVPIMAQSVMFTGDLLLELSLLFRAIIFGVLFTLLGVLALRDKSEKKPTYVQPLAWLSVFVGFLNFVMAIEWLYVFFLR